MAITYIEDIKNEYSNFVRDHLRKFNRTHTGNVEFDQNYIYVLENGLLVGALTVYFFWNWVSINHVFYKNQSVLNSLVSKAWDLYKEKAEGIKLITPVIERWYDFIHAGFIPTSVVNVTKSLKYYYADFLSKSTVTPEDYEMLVSKNENPKYQEILDQHYIDFNKKNNINVKLDDVRIVALDNNKFIGGISGEIYEDSLSIGRIIVDEKYRHKGIGSQLMTLVEDKAKEYGLRLLQLGTCEFQAKDFYEKLGYKVVYTRENNPRGFKSYTMFKRL